MRYGPGTDAWLSPPDPKVPPSGDDFVYVERESDNEGGWVELEIAVTYDEGSIFSATLNGKPFELTDDEKKRAEEDWAQREPDGPDEDDRRDDE